MRKNNIEKADPPSFDLGTCGSEDRRDILTTLRVLSGLNEALYIKQTKQQNTNEPHSAISS